MNGRPKKVDVDPVTLYARYLELGTLSALASELNVTTRTMKNYLRGFPKKRGRKKNKKIDTPFKRWFDARKAAGQPIPMLTNYPKTYEALVEEAGGQLPFTAGIFIRSMHLRHNEEITLIKRLVSRYLKANKAVADVRQRLLPTAAIKVVVIGKVKFDRKINVYLRLKDGTRAKLFFPYTPRIVPVEPTFPPA